MLAHTLTRSSGRLETNYEYSEPFGKELSPYRSPAHWYVSNDDRSVFEISSEHQQGSGYLVVQVILDSSAVATPYLIARSGFRQHSVNSTSAPQSPSETAMHHIKQLSNHGDLTQAIGVTYARIEKGFFEHDLLELNEFLQLAAADAESLHIRILVAMLRSTFRAQSKLFQWKALLSRTLSEIENRNLNKDRLLRGLI